jgi:hypothetical protein
MIIDCFLDLRETNAARIRPYPTGRLFWGGAVPGTSCQATVAPALRDIPQQVLAARINPGLSSLTPSGRACRAARALNRDKPWARLSRLFGRRHLLLIPGRAQRFPNSRPEDASDVSFVLPLQTRMVAVCNKTEPLIVALHSLVLSLVVIIQHISLTIFESDKQGFKIIFSESG